MPPSASSNWRSARRPADISSRNAANTAPLNDPTSIPTFTFDNKLYDATTGDPKPFDGRLTTTGNYNIQLSLRYSF